MANKQRGISSYITNLLINYKEFNTNPNTKIILFSDRLPQNDILKLNFDLIILPIKIYPLWDFIIPFILFFSKINLLHSPGNSSPIFKLGKIKYIVTIHDLIFFNTEFSGNLYQKIGRFYLKFNLWFNISKIDKIISVSNSTKFDLIKTFNLDEFKIRVIYESCHLDFFSEFKGPFFSLNNFICFGSDDPRKNTEFILKGFDSFFQKHKNFHLDVVGLPDKCIPKIKARLRLVNERNFRFHSFITRPQLLSLYERSIALVYPSLYEGFGIPLIEAFKTSTPVITSNLSSLPEISNGASILIDPYSSEEFLQALDFILVKENYDFFSVKSRRRANDFDWKIFSKETYNLYHEEL